eukprot:3697299-Pyramimonas_sp.AAC.2
MVYRSQLLFCGSIVCSVGRGRYGSIRRKSENSQWCEIGSHMSRLLPRSTLYDYCLLVSAAFRFTDAHLILVLIVTLAL